MSNVPRILLDEPSREEWLAARKRGVGGSEIAALVGCHPYLTPLKLWLQKTGRAPAEEESPRMRLGKAAETIILDEYQREAGVVAVLNSSLYSDESHFVLGTPDAFRVDPDREGVELKWHGARMRPNFGEAGSDGVPDHHFCQATLYAGLTGQPRWHFGVLFGNEGVLPFTIRFDLDLYAALTAAAEKFWKDHVLRDVPPDLDGSDDARRYVESRFPKDRAPLRTANERETEWLLSLLKIRAEVRALEEEESRLRTYLETSIGEAAGVEIPGEARVTWKATKDVTRVDWKAVYSSLLPKLPPDLFAAAEGLVMEATTVAPGSRRFLPTDLRKEKEN